MVEEEGDRRHERAWKGGSAIKRMVTQVCVKSLHGLWVQGSVCVCVCVCACVCVCVCV